MMLGFVKCSQSISGMNTKGLVLDSLTLQFNSLSSVRWSACPQCAHSDSITTVMFVSHKRPCTKGVAMASSAQAANTRSPVLKLKRWGVLSTVTGNAQLTSPAWLRTRKNRCFCNSSRIVLTRDSGRCNRRAMPSGLRGLPWLRGNSLTTKLRTR